MSNHQVSIIQSVPLLLFSCLFIFFFLIIQQVPTVVNAACLDRNAPGQNYSDCPNNVDKCTDALWVQLMREECPFTCNLCDDNAMLRLSDDDEDMSPKSDRKSRVRPRRIPSYKLLYFFVRGRGEAARFMLHYAGIPFTDERVDVEQWKTIKSSECFFLWLIKKSKMKFKQLHSAKCRC